MPACGVLRRAASVIERSTLGTACSSGAPLKYSAALKPKLLAIRLAGKLWMRVFRVEHDIIISLSRVRDLIFRGRQLFLQLEHVLVGLQLRIVLHHRQQLAHPGRDLSLRRHSRGLVRRVHRLGARLDHLRQRVALELHVAFDGFDQVGDQVMPALQLYVDLPPRIIYLIAQTD